jgi:hypothetical protein
LKYIAFDLLYTEKYVKKLIGRTDIEDALKRLDNLTHEEALMATAQVLKLTHSVDDKVTSVDDKITRIDDKVVNIGDKVTGVDDQVKEVVNGKRRSL